MISEVIPQSSSAWRHFGRNLNLAVIVIFLSMSLSIEIKPEVQRHCASCGSDTSDKLVQFAFISQIGEMVGGFSAISNSNYISRSGLIQVSKEETNGILHTLMIGQTDSSVFFENLAKDPNFCSQMEKPLTDKNSNTVSEYYPPKTVVAYSYYGRDNIICEYYGEFESPEVEKIFLDKILDLAAKASLHAAEPGLYVRAQRNLVSSLDFIKFDLELELYEALNYVTLQKLIQNEMALIRVLEKNGKAILADNIMLEAGYPVHIRIGKRAYLIFPYRYNSS